MRLNPKQIASIYGDDNSGSRDLKDYEIENINKFSSWLGRSYNFNQEHRLWSYNNKEDKLLYDIQIEYDNLTDQGLQLSIIAFNNIVKYINGDI